MEGVQWGQVGMLYSPVSAVAGPLTCCPGAAGLQLSTHARVCTGEQAINL